MLHLMLMGVAAAGAPPPGDYGMVLKVATFSRVPVLGDKPGLSVSWLQVTVSEDPDGVPRARHRACAVDMHGAGDAAKVWVAPSFLEALGTKDYRLEPGPGGGFAGDFGPDAVGWDPTAASGRLPQNLSDRGVVDWDGDGQPGATVHIDVPIFGSVQMFLVQRSRTRIAGHWQDGGVARGAVHSDYIEQFTLDATNPLFRLRTHMRPDPARSGFVLVPVPPGTACAAIKAEICAHPAGACAGLPR
jgi:hypothetical protein